jgi:hypothetical protein
MLKAIFVLVVVVFETFKLSLKLLPPVERVVVAVEFVKITLLISQFVPIVKTPEAMLSVGLFEPVGLSPRVEL